MKGQSIVVLGALALASSKGFVNCIEIILKPTIIQPSSKKKIQSLLECGKYPENNGLNPNLIGSIQSKRNERILMNISLVEATAKKFEENHSFEEAKEYWNNAEIMWNELIDSDPYYSKTALMISSYRKDVPCLEIFMSKGKGLDFNIKDHKGRTAFHFVCQETGDLNLQKEAVKLFLEHAEELQIDLMLLDNNGKQGFYYLPRVLKEEFSAKYPHLHMNFQK